MPAIDKIDNCESEQIRFTGSILPHGALLVVHAETAVIEAASVSCADLLGVAAETLLGQPLATLLGVSAGEALLSGQSEGLQPLVSCSLNGRLWSARANINATGQVLVDIEDAESSAAVLGVQYQCRRAIAALRRLSDAAAIATQAVVLIRQLTGFDRVMMYRFDHAWNGEVMAEACIDGVEPYLGLHFPASDIPRQVREWFLKSRVRQIPDALYTPSALVAHGDIRALDLGPSILRSVSPLHVEYLRNMGVRATLVGPLIVSGRLWGLVSCQQKSEPKYFGPADRDLLGWLFEDLSTLLEVTLAKERHKRKHDLSKRRKNLIETIREMDFKDLLRSGDTAELLGVVAADGFALLLDGAIHTTGRTPDIERIRELQTRRVELADVATLFSTDALSRDLGLEEANDGIAGALFVSVPTRPADTMIWFREERCLSIRWGGDPGEAHIADANGRLSPRKSFEQFLQEIRGQCPPWTSEELASAVQLGVLIEIEELREKEALLSCQRAQLRTLLDNLPDMVWMKNPEGLYLVLNARVERYFGADAAEIVGKNDYELVPIELAERFLQSDRHALESVGPIVSEEWVTYVRDGHQALLEVTKAPVRDEQGCLIGVLGIARDITERKQREVELQLYRGHLERMVEARMADLSITKEVSEAATRAKSVFLSTMSHELRTPLNGIMGMTELARRRATDPIQIDQLNKVSLASQRLLALISDILDIVRIEANKLTLEQVEFSLDSVMDNVTTLTHEQAASKKLEWRVEIAPALSALTLIGDPLRLGQVLLNLAANAVKFTAQGSIILRAALVEDQSSGILLRFEVCDTGIGIEAEDKKRIFNAFEQAEGSRTRKYGGTGLGLSISKRLVKLMGGEMDVESQIGLGSIFSFTARLGKVSPVTPPGRVDSTHTAGAQLKARHAGAMILVAEDDLLNQEIAQSLIEETGLVVHVASTGSEAVKMAMLKPYDAILMDIQMPDMDGLEATRQIRKFSGTAQATSADVVIIALTANVYAEDERRCREAGMNDFIGRPVDYECLLAVLLKWLDARRI